MLSGVPSYEQLCHPGKLQFVVRESARTVITATDESAPDLAAALLRYIIQVEGSWLFFRPPKTKKPNYTGKNQWKIHLSVNREDFRLAFPMVVNFLLTLNIYTFKCVSEQSVDQVLSDEENQHGKEFVIYFYEGMNAPELKERLLQLEQILLRNNIRSSIASRGDMPMPNSRGYFYYRNGASYAGNYFKAEYVKGYSNCGYNLHRDILDLFQGSKYIRPLAPSLRLTTAGMTIKNSLPKELSIYYFKIITEFFYAYQDALNLYYGSQSSQQSRRDAAEKRQLMNVYKLAEGVALLVAFNLYKQKIKIDDIKIGPLCIYLAYRLKHFDAASFEANLAALVCNAAGAMLLPPDSHQFFISEADRQMLNSQYLMLANLNVDTNYHRHLDGLTQNAGDFSESELKLVMGLFIRWSLLGKNKLLKLYVYADYNRLLYIQGIFSRLNMSFIKSIKLTFESALEFHAELINRYYQINKDAERAMDFLAQAHLMYLSEDINQSGRYGIKFAIFKLLLTLQAGEDRPAWIDTLMVSKPAYIQYYLTLKTDQLSLLHSNVSIHHLAHPYKVMIFLFNNMRRILDAAGTKGVAILLKINRYYNLSRPFSTNLEAFDIIYAKLILIMSGKYAEIFNSANTRFIRETSRRNLLTATKSPLFETLVIKGCRNLVELLCEDINNILHSIKMSDNRIFSSLGFAIHCNFDVVLNGKYFYMYEYLQIMLDRLLAEYPNPRVSINWVEKVDELKQSLGDAIAIRAKKNDMRIVSECYLNIISAAGHLASRIYPHAPEKQFLAILTIVEDQLNSIKLSLESRRNDDHVFFFKLGSDRVDLCQRIQKILEDNQALFKRIAKRV